MLRTLIALIGATSQRANPRLVEIAAAVAVVVGVTQLAGGGAGWIAGGVLGFLKAWSDDVARAAGKKAG